MNDIIFKNREKQLENCGFVKTVLMIIVIFYHCILFWSGNWFTKDPVLSSKILSLFSTYLNTFHIHTFTLVSGYIYCYIRFERNGYQFFIKFIKNKFKRLIIPYIFISLFWIIPINILFFNDTLKDLVLKFVAGVSPSQLWFLLMLFNVFVIVYPITKLIYRSNKYTVLIVLLFWMLGIIGQKFTINIFQLFTSLKFVSYFIVGFKIRQYTEKIKITKKILIKMFLLHILLFLFIFLMHQDIFLLQFV